MKIKSKNNVDTSSMNQAIKSIEEDIVELLKEKKYNNFDSKEIIMKIKELNKNGVIINCWTHRIQVL